MYQNCIHFCVFTATLTALWRDFYTCWWSLVAVIKSKRGSRQVWVLPEKLSVKVSIPRRQCFPYLLYLIRSIKLFNHYSLWDQFFLYKCSNHKCNCPQCPNVQQHKTKTINGSYTHGCCIMLFLVSWWPRCYPVQARPGLSTLSVQGSPPLPLLFMGQPRSGKLTVQQRAPLQLLSVSRDL